MKIASAYLKSLSLFTICLMLLSCAHVSKDRLPDPTIKSGIAKLSGKVINYQSKKGEEIPTISLYVPNPVTAEMTTFETLLKDDGSFLFEVPVECDMTIGHINSPFFNREAVCVALVPGEGTKIELSFDKAGEITPKMTSSLALTSNDILNYSKMFGNFLDANDHEPRYKMTPEEFSHIAIEKMMVDRIKASINDSLLSKNGKEYFTNECKLFYLKGCLLTYKEFIELNYRNFKAKGEPDNYTPQEPKKTYYAFLKDFKLNDPQSLYNDSYPLVLQQLLSNKTLNIPAINDTPVKDWLKEVKPIMDDLMGSETGLFYDMLAANAFARQFIHDLQPLSEKQKANIKAYFKNEEFTKILLKKNEVIIKLEKGKNYFKTVINTTPSVPKKELMNAIISKYKGKVVVVDFWATWCGPCMEAMKQTAAVKSELQGKDIAFVYITNVSSPKNLWDENIKVIGGEQYYLAADEWDTIMDSFGFKGIPSYLLYDKKGVIKNKATGYPGTKKMQKMIDELL